MRPRVFPAEDPRIPFRVPPCHLRFNEAAGIPRGRHTVPDADWTGASELQ